MPKEKEKMDLGLPKLDDLFSTQKERDEDKLRKVYEIPLGEIDPFPDHPFKVTDDEDMFALAESVKKNGVITPATVRKKEDGRYEMLSGHRRLRACRIAGLTTIRCEIVEMTKDEATIFMVESNFQRSKILPSEKAFAYKMRLEAMKRIPGRPSLDNYSPSGNNLERTSSEELAKEVGDSKSQIFRYIRLTELIPSLLHMVDEGLISMRPAVELSYLPPRRQQIVFRYIQREQCTPSHAQARRMRKLAEEKKLSDEVIEAIMMEEKPNQKERIVLRGDRFSKLFPKDLPYSRREEYVEAAMKFYRMYLERSRNDPGRER